MSVSPLPPVSPGGKTATELWARLGSGKTESAELGGNVFDTFLKETNLDQKVSEKAIEDLVTGKTDNVQQVVMAVAKADMSFQLFMEIRNKLVESYNELMRMQF